MHRLRRIFAVLTWTCLFFPLLALSAVTGGPSPAHGNSGEKTGFLFASVEEGRTVLASLDEYIEQMSPLDRSVRMKTDREVPREEFAAFAAGQVLPWKTEERAKLESVLAGVRTGLRDAGLPGLGTVTLIKTTGEEEGNAAYTRGRSIVLPSAMVRRPAPFLERLLAHELFHILSRNSPSARAALYEAIGFRHCGEIALPPALAARKITNPDAPRNEHCIRVRVNGEPVWVVPILFSTGERYEPGSGKGLFDYMQSALLVTEEGTGGRVRAKMGQGGPLLVDADQVSGFFDQVGRNTEYIIHPEEILAENFALLVTGEQGVPSPEILSRIRETLAKTPVGISDSSSTSAL